MEIDGDPSDFEPSDILAQVYNRLRPTEGNPRKLRMMIENYDCESKKEYDNFFEGATRAGKVTIVEKMKDDVAQMRAEEQGQRQLWIAAKNKYGNDYGNEREA